MRAALDHLLDAGPTQGGEPMPVEAITCTGCGSGDVQEVKADTYFCNHCESVFLVRRPHQGHRGECPCVLFVREEDRGAVPDRRVTMCTECDAAGKDTRTWRGSVYEVYVPTVGFGYLDLSSTGYIVADGQVVRGTAHGPVLPARPFSLPCLPSMHVATLLLGVCRRRRARRG